MFEVPANVFSASTSRPTAKVFALKCTEHVYSLEGVQGMRGKIAKVLGLKPHSLQLWSIKTGCIELHFLISADVANRIFPVSPAHESALSDIGVRVLFCEEVEQEESRYIVVYHIVRVMYTLLFTFCMCTSYSVHAVTGQYKRILCNLQWMCKNFLIMPQLLSHQVHQLKHSLKKPYR